MTSAAFFRKMFFVAGFLMVCNMFTVPALASGDLGCSPHWRLVHRNYDGCSNMAFLAPSNDSRVNLLLLMADLRPAGVSSGKAGAAGSPLFMWDTFVNGVGTQEDRTALKNSWSEAPSHPAGCPDLTPADEPFVLAVRADHTSKPEEADALMAARRAMGPGCSSDAEAGPVSTAIKTAASAPAKAFAMYLLGASAFHHADYEKAGAIFTTLTNAPSAWVRETATYMVGRALINRAQVGAFDEQGEIKAGWRADSTVVAAAECALNAYLRAYPKGVYAKSARGLKRRGYWLADETDKLAAEYGALLRMAPGERNVSDVELVQEIDNKLTTPPYPQQVTAGQKAGDTSESYARSPELLAMVDLMRMRVAEPDTQVAAGPSISLEALQAQESSFAAQPALYEYLLAAHAFYVENKPANVLRLLPDAARQATFSNVQFSRQMLRGMALEAVKDRNALGFWKQMLPGAKAPYQRSALELAIAYHEERAGEVRDVFAAGSPVQYPYLREMLLANVGDADLLRTQAKDTSVPQRERNIALFTLLYKEATRGYAADFLKDLALVPAHAPKEGMFLVEDTAYFDPDRGAVAPSPIPLGIFTSGKTASRFGCPTLSDTETALVRDKSNPAAQLCVAEFVRLNQGGVYVFNANLPADELGGTPSRFPGDEYVRMDTYKAVLENSKSSRNEKAYALFRAVNCYAPAGSNGCGGKDVPVAQRKAWFLTLKRDYAGTPWADELKYYW